MRYLNLATICGNVGLLVSIAVVFSPWVPRGWTARSYEIFLGAGVALGVLIGLGIAEWRRRRESRLS